MRLSYAETAWCPFARGKDGENRDEHGMGTFETRCITSACMAWQWDNKETGEGHCELINFPPINVLAGN